jgi:hypothetical protein
MKTFGIGIAAAALTLACGVAQADICSSQGISRAAALVLDANRTLGALPVGDGMQTDVSVKGQTMIVAFKSRVGDYVSAVMRCQTGDVAPNAVEKALAGFAGAKLPSGSPVKRRERGDDLRYGDALAFEVGMPQPGMIAIVARFGIECGQDAMLMIFERRGTAWM